MTGLRRSEALGSGDRDVTQCCFCGALDKAADTLVTLQESALHPAQLHASTAAEPARRTETFNDGPHRRGNGITFGPIRV